MPTVAEFLIDRLKTAGVHHVFGVTGEFVAPLFERLAGSGVELVATADEASAGFAADAYARVNGVGCVMATYNVGALKLVNPVACAYAERSPVIVISGAPSVRERGEQAVLHHMVRSYGCQKAIFDNITCASVTLDNPTTAGFEIDRVIEALKHHRQPVYIELPRDVAQKSITYDVYKQGTPVAPVSDCENLQEALEETISWLKSSETPVILAGIEIGRFGFSKRLLRFAEKANIPIATTMLSKSVVPERHPLYLGVYAGAASQDGVRNAVEKSDCLLMLGVMTGDVALSGLPAKFQKRNAVSCTVEQLHIKNHDYKEVVFGDFVEKLISSDVGRRTSAVRSGVLKERRGFSPGKRAITVARMFEKIDSILGENVLLIADAGDSLIGSIDLVVEDTFIGNALYSSMGTAIPGLLGLGLASPGKRLLAVVGDGSFQMSAQELSVISAKNLSPVIFVINNGGYATERATARGSFNDIPRWNYHNFSLVTGSGQGVEVRTEDELEAAVAKALASTHYTIINVVVEEGDVSDAMSKMHLS